MALVLLYEYTRTAHALYTLHITPRSCLHCFCFLLQALLYTAECALGLSYSCGGIPACKTDTLLFRGRDTGYVLVCSVVVKFHTKYFGVYTNDRIKCASNTAKILLYLLHVHVLKTEKLAADKETANTYSSSVHPVSYTHLTLPTICSV